MDKNRNLNDIHLELVRQGWNMVKKDRYLGFFDAECYFNQQYPDVFLLRRYDNKPGFEIFAKDERDHLNVDRVITRWEEMDRHIHTTLLPFKKI